MGARAKKSTGVGMGEEGGEGGERGEIGRAAGRERVFTFG